MAKCGTVVWIADLNLAGAASLAEEISASGQTAFAVSCDIGEDKQIQDTVDRVVRESGRLDIMHNNAALLDKPTVDGDKDIADISIDLWDRVMGVTLRGTMLGCRYAIAAMKNSGGGSIINTSSMISLAADNGLPAYSTAKAGINMITQWVAAKYGRAGIRCNAVAPSIIKTPALERSQPQEYVALHEACTLTPFLGTPEDIGNIVAFLASGQSRYITGQIIRADGGTTVSVPMYNGVREFLERS